MNDDERLCRIRDIISSYLDGELSAKNALLFIAYALDFWR